MDQMDEAQEINERHTDRHLARVRAAAHPKPPLGWDRASCVDCEEPVEEGRLRLGLFRCFACAQEREDAKRRGVA